MGMRALATGNVVWRSPVIGHEDYPQFEVIAKVVGEDRVIILKLKTGSGDYTYEALSPAHASELGQALKEGGEKLMEARS